MYEGSARIPAWQKGASNSIIDGGEITQGCWKMNSGPPEEQSVLLTAEPSLQPNTKVFKNKTFLTFLIKGL